MEREDTIDGPETIDVRGPRTAAEIRASADRYRVGDRIGRGGVGEVLHARDEQIGRDVAVKRLRTRDPDDRQVHRFLREACIQGRLQHPAIPPVHELGRDSEGQPFFVMRKLDGTTLAQILHAKKRAPQHTRQRLLRAFADVCLAVEFAHVRGVLHRDLKPANIMLGAFGEVFVLDWGVAKILGDSEFADVIGSSHPTGQGAMVGTPQYMAPEQLDGAPDLDARADVYSLGCLLGDILAIEGDAPPEIALLAVQSTAKDRAQRTQTARALGEGVQRYLDGDRDLELRRKLAGEHLDRARTAFAADDRRDAMREAGRAIALDPTLAGAAELLSRLMIEPPREMPREVEAAIEKHDIETNRRQARAGMLLYIAYFGFIPFLVGYHGGWWAPVAFGVIASLNIMFLWYRQSHPRIPNLWSLSLRNAIAIALVARCFSPLLAAPALAIVIATSSLFAAVYKSTRAVVGLGVAMLAGIMLPWLAEALGWIAPTISASDDSIHLLSPVPGVPAWLRYFAIAFFITFLMFAVTSLAHTMQRAARAARDQLELQAWQLRQLVT